DPTAPPSPAHRPRAHRRRPRRVRPHRARTRPLRRAPLARRAASHTTPTRPSSRSRRPPTRRPPPHEPSSLSTRRARHPARGRPTRLALLTSPTLGPSIFLIPRPSDFVTTLSHVQGADLAVHDVH